MILRLLMACLVLAGPAAADTARVFSGEHGDFTRLVIELPAATDWTLGRTPTGYAFAARTDDSPRFDLTGVWQRIARSRITDLGTDPNTGALQLSLGCACHVFPFEFRPGVVVLDVKPGPAPAGSAFEGDFVAVAARAQTALDPKPDADYNWLTDVPQHPVASATTLPLPLSTGEVSLQPLHDALLLQIARGAAEGVVDMRLPEPAVADSTPGTDPLPWSNLRIGEQPGIQISDPDAFIEGQLPTASCTPDDMLDLAAWGGDGAPLDLLAEARTGLFGEFDAPDPAAVLRSVRLHLFLGFGAEAGQQAGLVTDGTEAEAFALYRSMAHILDGDSDPDTPFATMLDCDGAAALWAALARDRLPAGPGVNRDAILRAFQALPPHLRGQLGPALAEKFLALDDADAARMIRDAMERAPEADATKVALLDAESDLHQGNLDGALDHARNAVALDGMDVEGLIALVEAHLRKLEPIDPDVPTLLQSLQGETRGTEIAPDIDRAIVLAQALSGQTDAAFELAGDRDDLQSDLWQVVQARATDDDFLRHAVLSPESMDPLVPGKLVTGELGLAIAKRLLSLGFPDAARVWIGPAGSSDPEDRRLAAAEAEYGRGDARAAIDLLAGSSGPEAEMLRARALVQLNDLPKASAALTAAGDGDAAERALLWQGDWSAASTGAPEVWSNLALQVSQSAAEAEGPLGRGTRALEASAASRAAIDALLASVGTAAGN